MEVSQSFVSIAILGIFIVGMILWFRYQSKQKSQFGINLNRVTCPVCQTKQPIVRMPNSTRQFMWGGTTCPKCKNDLDKYGDIIS